MELFLIGIVILLGVVISQRAELKREETNLAILLKGRGIR